MGKLKQFFELFKDTVTEWSEDKAATWAAALAYYTIFSIGPLLLIAISIAGLVFGQAAAQGQIVGTIGGMVGREGGEVIQGLLQAANRPREGIIGAIIGIGTLLLGASGFFGQLQASLNRMWEVEPPKRGILETVKAKSLTFLMVFVAGGLVIALLAATTAISAVTTYFGDFLPGPAAGFLLQAVDFLVSFGVITLVFAGIYRFVPDTTVAWRSVWLGAAFTSLLFVIGKIALGIYFAQASPGSAFGAAGSLVVLLVWIYYSAQIFLFGAEFTQVFSNKYGPKEVPAENPRQPEAARTIAAHGGPPEEKGKGEPEREQVAREGASGDASKDGKGMDRAASRQADQDEPWVEGEGKEKRVVAWRGGPSYRPSPIRAAIMQLSVVVGIAAAAIGILRGRG